MKKKIAFCTGTRAEYGLLKPLMELVLHDPDLEFELYVTGMHLSLEFGHTIDEILQDKIPVTEKVEILVSGDTPSAISKSMGLAMIGFGDVFARRKPDMLVLLGDRFEAFCAAAAATVARVPIAHLHGGELTLGAIDDAFRHSITKMSSLHFTSTEEYRHRVIQMGEEPSRVFNVGALGVENILKLPLMTLKELEKSLGVRFKTPYALVTYHPATLDDMDPENQILELLNALDSFPGLFLVFTKANADAGGRVINKLIDDYVSKNMERAVVFSNMGQIQYLSAMKFASMVIGNSSSGIIETPSFGVPTVNIGKRQEGRVKAKSVFACAVETKSIRKAITEVQATARNKQDQVSNPYYGKDTAKTIYKIIRDFLLAGITNKGF